MWSDIRLTRPTWWLLFLHTTHQHNPEDDSARSLIWSGAWNSQETCAYNPEITSCWIANYLEMGRSHSYGSLLEGNLYLHQTINRQFHQTPYCIINIYICICMYISIYYISIYIDCIFMQWYSRLGVSQNRGTPSHDPFRTMGFSLKLKTIHPWGYHHGHGNHHFCVC